MESRYNKNWMCMNHLQMNDTKTEFITFGTPHLLCKKFDSITVGGTTVSCSKTVKFFGAFLDETCLLSNMWQHEIYTVRDTSHKM